MAPGAEEPFMSLEWTGFIALQNARVGYHLFYIPIWYSATLIPADGLLYYMYSMWPWISQVPGRRSVVRVIFSSGGGRHDVCCIYLDIWRLFGSTAVCLSREAIKPISMTYYYTIQLTY